MGAGQPSLALAALRVATRSQRARDTACSTVIVLVVVVVVVAFFNKTLTIAKQNI